MELGEKLQELRKRKGLTQEELADLLFVSRTAVSKWESNRGLPSLDSLKALSNFFGVSVDQLISGDQLINLAQDESKKKTNNLKEICFGLLDLLMSLLFVLPIFALRIGDEVLSVNFIELQTYAYIKIPYLVAILLSICCGIVMLALQNQNVKIWTKSKFYVSLCISLVLCAFFVLSAQPYPANFTLLLLFCKVLILLKRQ